MIPRYPIDGVIYPSPEDAERYARLGAWNPLTAGDALRATAARFPDKAALVGGGRRLTYGEFDAATEKLGAALLGLGLRPGDRALFQMGSVIETVIALLGCAKAGIVPVCTLPQHRAIEIGEMAARAEPAAYFVQADYGAYIRHVIVARAGDGGADGMPVFEALIEAQSLDRARGTLAGVELSLADVLMLQLSGGTTNVPKIMPRFHGEFLGLARAKAVRSDMDERMVALYAMPIIHTAGQVAMLYPAILFGGTCVLMPRMDVKEYFDTVERERVTHSVNMGPAAIQMVDYEGIGDHDLTSLKLLMNFHGSGTMERHVGVPCLNTYGIGEGMIMSTDLASSPEMRHDTVGWPLSPLDEVRIVDPDTEAPVAPGEMGELYIRGPSSIRGYFKMPDVNRESFTEEGFFRTGDKMSVDEIEGRTCYRFQGRIKDNINRGGEKIGAEEVEAVILRHPDVADAKVVAMPDRLYGEKACAFLIMMPGTAALTVETLGAFLLDQGLARFKAPERIETVETYPVTRVGKVDRQALRARIAEILAAG
jgi:non-ribosomal peptide synthetase component E (peptide arylation enzyme)